MAAVGTATIRQVEVFVGTVIAPAIDGHVQYTTGPATITGASGPQTSPFVFGTPTTPVVVADCTTLSVSLNATAVTGTPPAPSADGHVLLASVNIGRVEPDSATASARTVSPIVSIPVKAQVDTSGNLVLPASIFATIGAGQQYNVDFGAYVTVNIVLPAWATNLTYSWSFYGKT